MKIDENYSIENDSNNWILRFEEERVKEKTGKKYISTNEWYFSNLETGLKSLLKKYRDQKLKECETVVEILAQINKSDETIKNLKL